MDYNLIYEQSKSLLDNYNDYKFHDSIISIFPCDHNSILMYLSLMDFR